MSFEKPSDPEEAYFKRQELELRKQIRAQLVQSVDALQKQAQTPELIERIRALGFAGENAQVVDLLPLVQVAWADGSVSSRERILILKVLEQRGIAPDSNPFRLIESLLETRPSDGFLAESTKILKDLIGPEHANNIVDYCLAVANASGGILGFGKKISTQEQELIETIAQALGPAVLEQFYRQLE